jgi:hypothetical protein
MKSAVTIHTQPSRAEVLGKLDELAAGAITREEASAWADEWITKEDVPGSEIRVRDEAAWEAVMALSGADTPDLDRSYLYDAVDFRGWADALRAAPRETITLWRPVGPAELQLIQDADFRAFPPRLPEQPIFYPVLIEQYAIQIARDWNVKADGVGFVTRFEVQRAFLDAYSVQQAGGRQHLEYWIPAEDLPAFNDAIVGRIEVTAEFR